MDNIMQLEQARCAQPFSHLGPANTFRGSKISAFVPDAESVSVVLPGEDETLFELERVEEHGHLFSGVSETFDSKTRYELSVKTANSTYRYLDPYQFQEEAFHGVHFIDHDPQNLYRQAGAQKVVLDTGSIGVRFSVYAPNASAVSLIGDFNFWDGRRHPMEKTDLGYWVLVVPGLSDGDRYKYQLKDGAGNDLPHKADPLGYHAELHPSHASMVYDHDVYQWNDDAWMTSRLADKYHAPMTIYEVHMGSWKKHPGKSPGYYSYSELAETLIPYVVEMGYTHIELLPISEYPFDGSWGYQPVGLFAPTSRFGNPDDFKYFVDQCHQAGLGIIIDWVPAHFPEDGHGLARFDGTHVYEYEDPRKGWHPDWKSCIYDYGKGSVRQFLVSNALYWLDKFHIDGLRVDAVASMLYLDYSRKEGEWLANSNGGNENYEASSLLKWMNQEVYKRYPGAMTIAEESTSYSKVSRPVFAGGLGFGFKWNMGWMNDSLHYMSIEPEHRRHHHGDITFSMMYAYNENFILPISHDEVVHGKHSLIEKMPGDEWQQAANLRCYAAFMFGHPGKKLNFMGVELAQTREWNHDGELDWGLLQYDKHRGVQGLYKALNHLYKSQPALHEQDHEPEGFKWIDHEYADISVMSFIRRSLSGENNVYVICNFTPAPRKQFRLGVESPGSYALLLNTDSEEFWGSEFPTPDRVVAQPVPWNNQPYSIEIELPPLATLYWIQG